MPTFAELISRTDALVQDTSLTSLIGAFINQGVYEIAGGMQSVLCTGITPPLPKLFTIGTVATSTSAAYVNMPDTFHRNLQLAVSSNGSEIEIAHSLIEFTESYPLLDRSGGISEVVEHGGRLYYQGIPTTSETLTIHYYRKPVDMIETTDTPDGIPEHLQMSLLVNFAAWKAFEFIEDGLEGEIINTQKYMNAFFSALKTLELTIPDYTRGINLR